MERGCTARLYRTHGGGRVCSECVLLIHITHDELPARLYAWGGPGVRGTLPPTPCNVLTAPGPYTP